MDIPWQELSPGTLRSLIEEFVSRDGTDYGSSEASFEKKIQDIEHLLKAGKAKIVFDAETESCDIREAVKR